MIKTRNKIKILGVETTCDETGLAILEFDLKKERFRILANELALQYRVHQPYGGVVPILAAREHEKNLQILWQKIKLKVNPRTIDYIAFAYGPGLEPALLRGRDFTINLAKELKIKILPVNHLAGHFYSFLAKPLEKNYWQTLKAIQFPAIGLIISGGHTILYLFKNYFKKKKLGETIDDAVGEAFDKVGRMLDFPYPGGPKIEKLAKKGKPLFILPKPILERKFDFSFAGLKTAVLELVNELKFYDKFSEKTKADIAASFQKTIFEILIYKTLKAIRTFKAKTIVAGGGVAANRSLKREMKKFFKNYQVYFPDKILATDNAINIALAGYFSLQEGKSPLTNPDKLEVYPRLKW
mgnify:CR=1 FL=1